MLQVANDSRPWRWRVATVAQREQAQYRVPKIHYLFVVAAESPEGINSNSHGRGDGTPVPECNPWLAKERMPTPEGLNSRPSVDVEPLQG
jgi:hypothetical protein